MTDDTTPQQSDVALAAARKALAANPDDAGAHATVAESLLTLERWDEGVTAVDEALRRSPNSEFLHRLKCVGLENLRRYDQAIACAQRALELAPGESNAWFLLGKNLWQSSRDAEARAALERAIALDPLVPLYRFTLATFVFDSDAAVAEQLFQRVVTDEPTHARALNELGVLLERRGDFAGARALYDRARGADPNLEAAKHNALRASRTRWLAFGVGTALLVVMSGVVPVMLGAVGWQNGHPVLAVAGWASALFSTIYYASRLPRLARNWRASRPERAT